MIIASQTQFHNERPCNSVLNVKALVGAFNQEKALVGIVKTSPRRGVAVACSGRGNGEQQRQNSKNVVRNVADCNSSQSSLCPGRDGAHDANMNKDWCKESAADIRHHFDLINYEKLFRYPKHHSQPPLKVLFQKLNV